MTSIPTCLFGAALGLGLLLAQPALAFSQIGTKDGAAPQREGIVAVPLPPLAGTAAPAPPPAAESQTPAGVPTSPGNEPDDPGTPTPAAGPTDDPDAAPPGDEIEAPAETQEPASDAEPIEGAEPRSDGSAAAAATAGESAETGTPPPVVYGDEDLPKPVRDLRRTLITLAEAGDVEALRPYIQLGDEATLLSFGGAEGDPIAFLKSASGDGEGVEILAIMLEVLEAGHVRNEAGTDSEIFVWPYFTALALDKLTKPQKVELFELVTAGDYQEMLGFGAYNFYRLGISPDGKLQFFVAGD